MKKFRDLLQGGGDFMKTRIRILGMLLAVSLLAGCGGASKEAASSAPMAEAPMEDAIEEGYFADDVITEEAAAAGVETTAEISKTAQVNRKLIRTFFIDIQTKEFDQVISEIQEQINELGGYIENSSMDSGSAYYSNYNRYSNMTVRIPSSKLDGFVNHVKENANVTNISESTEDITLKYVDVESRKIALETERDRLLELLGQAETVEDIITIEGRLSEVRYQLESYASQLRTFDNQVDYSTVHIDICEVDRETKVEPKTFWDEVTDEFGDSIYGLTRGFRNLAIWFLGSSPYLILWAAVIVAGIFGIKFIKGKKVLKRTLQKVETEIKDDITE